MTNSQRNLRTVYNHFYLFYFKVTSNTLIFLAVNIAGVYIHDRTQRAQRKAFLDTRNCIAARLDMEDENEKLVRLHLIAHTFVH